MDDHVEGLSREVFLKRAAAVGAGATLAGGVAAAPALASGRRVRARTAALSARNFGWALVPGKPYGIKGYELVCFPSDTGSQVLAQFWQKLPSSPSFDKGLAAATAEVQRILDPLVRQELSKKRELSLILVNGRMLLASARRIARRPATKIVEDADPAAKVARALGLTARSLSAESTLILASTSGYSWNHPGNVTGGPYPLAYCAPDTTSDCVPFSWFWYAKPVAVFHLTSFNLATTEVQSVLTSWQSKGSPGRNLSVMAFDHQPLLAWTVSGVASASPYSQVVDALGLDLKSRK
jgi:hypothetical protein